jgi:hypothetical protein
VCDAVVTARSSRPAGPGSTSIRLHPLAIEGEYPLRGSSNAMAHEMRSEEAVTRVCAATEVPRDLRRVAGKLWRPRVPDLGEGAVGPRANGWWTRRADDVYVVVDDFHLGLARLVVSVWPPCRRVSRITRTCGRCRTSHVLLDYPLLPMPDRQPFVNLVS